MAQNAKPSWVSRPPRVGNVITSRYPNDPKAVLRPCLVLEVQENSGSYAVRVAYGTSTLKIEQRGNIDIIAQSQSDLDANGVAVPTRFDLENTALIPWEEPECGCWRGKYSPVLGNLTRDQEEDAARKLAALQNKQRT